MERGGYLFANWYFGCGKARLAERSVKGLQPKQKNIIVYDEEVVGFGVRITSGGKSGRKACAFILTCLTEARERRAGKADQGSMGRKLVEPALLRHSFLGSRVQLTGATFAFGLLNCILDQPPGLFPKLLVQYAIMPHLAPLAQLGLEKKSCVEVRAIKAIVTIIYAIQSGMFWSLR